jgi:menaquinone-9 beta-reductase
MPPAGMTGAVIIGGGPAGAAAATVIARAGRTVTLIERTADATDKVCGDFLSADAISAVGALGLDLAAFAPAPITALRLVHGGQVATTRLPFLALGLSRRVLDEALLQRAQASGAAVLRGHAVRRLLPADGYGATGEAYPAVALDCGPLGTVTADAVFLATGKHDLHGIARPGRGTGPVGLKMYYALDPRRHAALSGNVELVLFGGGYAGLQPVEAGRAVLCVLVSRARLRASGGSWDTLLDSLLEECPHLADRLVGAKPQRERPVAVAGLPYGYQYAPKRHAPPSLFRIGDQCAVIASLTGDGVALALASAALAAQAWLQDGNVAAAFHSTLAARLSRQMRIASAIHRLCLTPFAQPWLLYACRAWPAAIRLAASLTRSECGLRNA